MRGNGGAGVLVAGEGTGGALLVRNEVQANGAEGVLLGSGADPMLEKNEIRENRGGGVKFLAGSR